jgi:hypothetical protein
MQGQIRPGGRMGIKHTILAMKDVYLVAMAVKLPSNGAPVTLHYLVEVIRLRRRGESDTGIIL